MLDELKQGSEETVKSMVYVKKKRARRWLNRRSSKRHS